MNHSLAENPRIAEEELRVIAEAKRTLDALATRWPGLDAKGQLDAIRDATGALVILQLAEPSRRRRDSNKLSP